MLDDVRATADRTSVMLTEAISHLAQADETVKKSSMLVGAIDEGLGLPSIALYRARGEEITRQINSVMDQIQEMDEGFHQFVQRFRS